jgi:hypothetical protein
MRIATAQGVQFEVWNDGCSAGLFTRTVEQFEDALAALPAEEVKALYLLASADMLTRGILDPSAIERLDAIANRPLAEKAGAGVIVAAALMEPRVRAN